MKSTKGFILWLLALYVCLFVFDWMKTSVFPLQHHSIIVWSKTFFLVVFGTLIMALTLPANSFRDFITVYCGMWIVYFILKYLPHLNVEIGNGKIPLSGIFLSYVNFTQILTPLPFIAFWIFNRVYLTRTYSVDEQNDFIDSPK